MLASASNEDKFIKTPSIINSSQRNRERFYSEYNPTFATPVKVEGAIDGHRKRFGEDAEALPVTPQFIEAVAAQMKRARYRPLENCIAAAKREHLKFDDGTGAS